MAPERPVVAPEEIFRAAVAAVDRSMGPGLRETTRDLLQSFGVAAFSHTPPRIPPLAALPGLVHAAITGEAAPALPLCGAALLLYLGVDILDDLMDGDVTSYWQAPTAAETLLTATALVAAMPAAIVAGLGVPAARRDDLHRLFARRMLEIADGQRADLRLAGVTAVAPADVMTSVAAKSGAFAALLAEWGAQLAGAEPVVTAAYGEWGMAYGTADQIRSDCADLYREPVGSDLLHGTLSYPLACLLDHYEGEQRERTMALIRGAATGSATRAELRRELEEGGTLAFVGMMVNYQLVQAEAALVRAAPREPAAAALRALTASLPLTATGSVAAQ
jgi:geranylgeranyl pyrophosphate synthase